VRKRRDIESPLQAAMLELLAAGYPDVWVCSIPNGGYIMEPRTVAKLKWLGLRPGAPDLLLVWTDGVGFVEVKAPKGVVSDDQKSVHKTLRAKGHRVSVCRSLEDLIATLIEWNVPTRRVDVRVEPL